MTRAVQVRGLRKTYGETVAVDGIDLTVGTGEIFGLIGPNGAGKSTSVECMLGTRTPDSGSVRLLGLDPSQDRARLFERVGVQFQEMGYQDKIRVGELCRLTSGLYAAAADWRRLLARFGLEAKVREPVTALSGGQRQRLAIVQALIPEPELLFLDELTTGLDPRARRAVWRLVQDLRDDGVTVVLTSHFMDEVEHLCDRIAILVAGRIVAQGTPADVVRQAAAAGLEEAFLSYAGQGPDAEEGSW